MNIDEFLEKLKQDRKDKNKAFTLDAKSWDVWTEFARQFFEDRGTGPVGFVSWEMALRMCALYGAYNFRDARNRFEPRRRESEMGT